MGRGEPPYRKLTFAEAFERLRLARFQTPMPAPSKREQRGGFTGFAIAADPSWCSVKRLRGLEIWELDVWKLRVRVGPLRETKDRRPGDRRPETGGSK